MSELRNIPEYVATQVNLNNDDYVYIKPHKRGNKWVNAYICKKREIRKKNPNIGKSVIQEYKESLKKSEE